jgi:hypothetical protein
MRVGLRRASELERSAFLTSPMHQPTPGTSMCGNISIRHKEGVRVASARFSVFCTPNEIRSWTQLLCQKYVLRCLAFRPDGGYLVAISYLHQLDKDVYRIFLVPNTYPLESPFTLDNVEPRKHGWVDITVGQLLETPDSSVLTYSEIHADDSHNGQVRSTRYVRWLKRMVRPTVTAGVIGKNVVYGGEAISHDINYSQSAYELYLEGVVWKQFIDGNVIFEPVVKHAHE